MISTVGVVAMLLVKNTLITEDAATRIKDTRMKQPLKTAGLVAPVVASTTQTGKHSKTAEVVGRKEKSKKY